MMTKSYKLAMLKRCYNRNQLHKRFTFAEWLAGLTAHDIDNIAKQEESTLTSR